MRPGRLGGLALLLAAAGGCGGDETAAPAPTRRVDLAELQEAIAARRGAPLLINFWATW